MKYMQNRLHAEEPAQSLATSESPSAAEICEPPKTVLVVDDEPMVRELETQVLRVQGYKVLATRTPSEALLVARNHAGTIQLILTDVILPEMNGRELSEQLLPLNPGAKRLYMSGYTSNVIARHGVLDAGVDFIQKPFTSEDLTVKIREVLCGQDNAQIEG